MNYPSQLKVVWLISNDSWYDTSLWILKTSSSSVVKSYEVMKVSKEFNEKWNIHMRITGKMRKAIKRKKYLLPEGKITKYVIRSNWVDCVV